MIAGILEEILGDKLLTLSGIANYIFCWHSSQTAHLRDQPICTKVLNSCQ